MRRSLRLGLVAFVALTALACEGTLGGSAGDGGVDGGDTACLHVRCPPAQRCSSGACVRDDPCVDVECPEEGTVCSHGSCVSPSLDEDGDGSPAADDCDDHDADVFAGTVAPCETACGEGTTTCVAARWLDCTAPTDCDCRPGQERTEPCGNCGESTRTCRADGTWGGAGRCEAEGDCSPGSSDVEACAETCSQHTRTCADDCTWDDWDACVGQSDCTPGQVDAQPCGNCGATTRTCDDACLWGAFGACEDGGGVCTPGQTEVASCGVCLAQSRDCQADCTWGAWGACSGQSACTPGQVETVACGNCGTQSRTCQADCSWSGFGACAGEGVCAPGEPWTQACEACGTQSQVCSNGCTWPGFGACAGGCPGWTCTGAWYGTSDGCDCGCGIIDPDCGGIGCTAPDCCAAGDCQGCGYCWPSTGFCG